MTRQHMSFQMQQQQVNAGSTAAAAAAAAGQPQPAALTLMVWYTARAAAKGPMALPTSLAPWAKATAHADNTCDAHGVQQ